MANADTELYRTLGLEPAKVDVTKLTQKDITTAYRKAALKHHPDKNRDNPSATEVFSRLFLAYETLSDAPQRAAYDAAIRAARAHAQRLARQNANRQRLRRSLEAREAAAAGGKSHAQQQQHGHEGFEQQAKPFRPHMRDTLERVQKEIERLRKEAMATPNTTRATQQQQYGSAGVRAGAPQASPWLLVPGFDKFRSDDCNDFTAFETAVLAGRDPF